SISTNGMSVQAGKSIGSHIAFGTGRVRSVRVPAPRPGAGEPRGGGSVPHTGVRGGGLENHTGPFSASLTGERGRTPVPTRLPGSPRSVSHEPLDPGRVCSGAADGGLRARVRAPRVGGRQHPTHGAAQRALRRAE